MKEVASHTPAPWKCYPVPVSDNEYRLYDGEDNIPETNYAERCANAKLIASAPELLAALEASQKQLTYVSAFLTAIREDIQAGDSKDFADKFCEIVVMQDGLAFVVAQAEAAIQRAKP